MAKWRWVAPTGTKYTGGTISSGGSTQRAKAAATTEAEKAQIEAQRISTITAKAGGTVSSSEIKAFERRYGEGSWVASGGTTTTAPTTTPPSTIQDTDVKVEQPTDIRQRVAQTDQYRGGTVEPAQRVSPFYSRIKGKVSRVYQRRVKPIFYAEKFQPFRKEAVITALSFGVGAAAVPALGAAGRVGARVAPLTTKVTGYVGGVTLGAYTVKESAKAIITAPKSEKVTTTIGVGSQIVSTGVGGVTGLRATRKITGVARTMGRTLVPAQKIVEPKVLAKQKTFPTAPPKTHLKLFTQSKYKLPAETKPAVFHAAPTPFKKVTQTQPGTSEIAGLYTSPSLSPHFLKTSKPEGVTPGLSLFPEVGGKPTILRITPEAIKPGKYAPSTQYKTKFELVGARKGTAYVPGMKTEIEAIIPPETQLQRAKRRYYTVYEKQRVPIEEYKVVSGKAPKSQKDLITAKGLKSKVSSRVTSPKTLSSPLIPSYSRTTKPRLSYPTTRTRSRRASRVSSGLKRSVVSVPPLRRPVSLPPSRPPSKVITRPPTYPRKPVSRYSPYIYSKQTYPVSRFKYDRKGTQMFTQRTFKISQPRYTPTLIAREYKYEAPFSLGELGKMGVTGTGIRFLPRSRRKKKRKR